MKDYSQFMHLFRLNTASIITESIQKSLE